MVKLLVAKVLRSHWKLSDTYSIIKSLIFYPKYVFISNSIRRLGKGKITAESPFFYGIASNKLGLDMKAFGILEIAKGAHLEIGKNVRIARGCKLHINNYLFIGDNTYVQPNALILANTKSFIGTDGAIGWNFQMLDDDLHQILEEGNIKRGPEPINIGSHVWIGSNVTILKGISIGNNSIIATGSVVTKSVPENVLVAGNPAKVIKTEINWS